MQMRLFPRPRKAWVAACVALAVALAAPLPCLAATDRAVRGGNGMVVAIDARAVEVGVETLRRGGNAVDAAVATAFTLAVTYPAAGNLGGGGLMLLRTSEGEFAALDFREQAPAALRPELFLDEDGQPVPGLSRETGLAVGVPGTVAGLAEAHQRWGSLPWADLIRPAIRLAEEGFPLSRWNAYTFSLRAERLAADPESRAIFTRGGTPLGELDRLVQPDLAETLRRIAESGAGGFYGGPVAEGIVSTIKRSGGVMHLDDLASYRAVLREPVETDYRGYRVVSFPPPSSGGIVLLQILEMLETFDLSASGFGSSLTIHRMVEAERRGYADRSEWLGDPAFFTVPTEELLSPDYLASRAAKIRDRKATPSKRVRPLERATVESTETTHLSVADARGNAVAMTLTLNAFFGSAIVGENTGVLLNNQVDDFAIAPGVPNLWGLVGGEANAVAGGKRPLSSMTPTIVEAPGGGPRPFLVLGSPGGATIITTVLQVLVNVIDHDLPLQEAVEAPRFHHQWYPDHIEYETRAFPADVAVALESRGHRLKLRDLMLGNVSAIGLDEDGAWLGAADPRREGSAAGY